MAAVSFAVPASSYGRRHRRLGTNRHPHGRPCVFDALVVALAWMNDAAPWIGPSLTGEPNRTRSIIETIHGG